MGKMLTGIFLQFYKAIDEILWEDWDPIGISDTTVARDEYQGYVPRVYKLSLENKAEELTQYLLYVEQERMGLKGNKEKCRKTVDLIMTTKNNLGL